MEKYNWTPEQIDKLEVEKIIELEFGNWREKIKEEQLDTVDSIKGFS